MEKYSVEPGPIGVFDSGYGGLTILKAICEHLPQYDYLYLGDNARAPYGTRSFDLVYRFTLEAVKYLFRQGCHLIILACNTASAKALRNIQQKDLPGLDPARRVLGVIRPTVEAVASNYTTKNIGIFATSGTVASKSYEIEIEKMFPECATTAHACPLWVPIIENNAFDTQGARYFIKQDVDALLQSNPNIETVILGCTHYPIIKNQIKEFLPSHIKIIEQGEIVASSLADYLRRHPEMENKCSKNHSVTFLTTDDSIHFDENASLFLGQTITSKQINLS